MHSSTGISSHPQHRRTPDTLFLVDVYKNLLSKLEENQSIDCRVSEGNASLTLPSLKAELWLKGRSRSCRLIGWVAAGKVNRERSCHESRKSQVCSPRPFRSLPSRTTLPHDLPNSHDHRSQVPACVCLPPSWCGVCLCSSSLPALGSRSTLLYQSIYLSLVLHLSSHSFIHPTY